MAFCENCGNEVSNEVKFCENCGSKIDIGSDKELNQNEVPVTWNSEKFIEKYPPNERSFADGFSDEQIKNIMSLEKLAESDIDLFD